MYGIQTQNIRGELYRTFENDVKMYGIQTDAQKDTTWQLFENDVKMYGIQTESKLSSIGKGLRMM